MGVGFIQPPAGAIMCQYLVANSSVGLLPHPRPRKRPARAGAFCRLHARIAARWADVEVRPGGFCSFCSEPAKSYCRGGVTIAICGRCGKSLARAIREGR
jgi:hypothetical protein